MATEARPTAGLRWFCATLEVRSAHVTANSKGNPAQIQSRFTAPHPDLTAHEGTLGRMEFRRRTGMDWPVCLLLPELCAGLTSGKSGTHGEENFLDIESPEGYNRANMCALTR